MPAHELMSWLRSSRWYPLKNGDACMVPALSDNGWLCVSTVRKERFYRNVGLWLDGVHRNSGLATCRESKNLRVATDELLPCRRFGNMLCGNESEELF